MSEFLRVERAGAVATLWIDRQPKMNTMTVAMRNEFPSIFRDLDADDAVREIEETFKGWDGTVAVRGVYSTAGFRADSDLMLWLVGPSADALQDALVAFGRTRAGRELETSWTFMGVVKPAEFTADHAPAFVKGTPPGRYLCVYPFVRSYEWYLLEDAERRRMLAEHGQMARGYADVRANTVASFALGDYEWMLAFEADDLHRIVDLMRDLRASDARRHVREEVPSYTGARVTPADLIARLP